MPVEYVLLVNKNDQPLGTMEKITAHERGELHRAFSVFVFNSKGEMMLQKRASEKYHSGGLWTNTVCSHPKAGEEVKAAAIRRMNEEMGFTCDIEEAFKFTYKSDVGDGLTENEFDHVFIGNSDRQPKPNPEEVEDWKYVTIDWLVQDVEKHPEHYTVWFVIALKELLKQTELQQKTNK
ncbi:MAG: isopentenyl-diphosphate delta-isomerase [Bacteroidetes bacterium]|nr:MAG: isopentenyl-diphosphate delta-isomerase [Bacteroidota bacterium]RLD88944.1 MAG: isopentenyl-diphosphate delta-isomerase [Bacteroidota bacterium]